MPSHTVQQGEHLSGIAQKYGFQSYKSIWDHANNGNLKKKRGNPNVLYPGDLLFIPDKTEKTAPCATGATHVFKVKVPKLKLTVIVQNRAGKPVPNAECELEIDGQKYVLTSDTNGLVEQSIPRTATSGTFRVPKLDIESPVLIGHLDPIDEKSGLAGRLRNLGYYRGNLDNVDEDELGSAIEEFQCDHRLTVDGKFGQQTRAKLEEIHGC